MLDQRTAPLPDFIRDIAPVASIARVALSPIEYGKRIAEETDKWAKVIKFSGAKAN
jgi:hypothetical protein